MANLPPNKTTKPVLSDLEGRQDKLLNQLDELNRRIEAALAENGYEVT